MSISRNLKQFNTNKSYGLIGIGENSSKLINDFIYIFDDKLNIEEVNNIDNLSDELNDSRYDGYICCCYDRNNAKSKLAAAGLKYNIDFFFAEDLFELLDDWKGCRIAYKSYPGNIDGWLKAIVFGHAARHGIVMPEDKFRYIVTKKHVAKTENVLVRRTSYVLNLIPGLFEWIFQAGAKNNDYKKYDYICFYSVADAIRFSNDFPSLKEKVITTEELKVHTMSSLFMRETYFDKRQTKCECVFPFNTLWVGKGGSGRLCDCPDYLDIGFGNIGVTGLNKIWNSPLARIIRLSVVNNTYTFCSRTLCGNLSDDKESGTLLKRREISENGSPNRINIANDSVCNLHCPSCRKQIYARNTDDANIEISTCTDVLINAGWLDKTEELIVGGGGETFLSDYYKRVLCGEGSKRKSVTIMTNGTLFTLKEWEQLEGKYEHIKFMVSIDAATKDTYEKVRCGGNWNKLMDNMSFMSELRRNNKIDEVTVIMIVQKANYKEIPDFIRWAKDKGFDKVSLSHIRNWWTFEDDYFHDNVSMFDRSGHIKTELKEIMDNPICSDSVVVTSW
ncbi:MAG: hypothetical protein K5659_05050 [Lachnospiraceae bacterium]|nr:hypothetical protein [Lachnospiraceae bacterium]